MNASPDNQESVLMALALEKPAGQRLEFLRMVCGADEPAFRRLEARLAAMERDGQTLAAGSDEALPTVGIEAAQPDDDAVGRSFGLYRLVERIGEGGCGVVYAAEQSGPLRRIVALKVIKLGMDTRNVVARFNAERQALAMMDHPNIARVFDAGATDQGRPYFAMELVRGVHITTFCDERRLATRDRLELFIKVCNAIQHAHDKGVVHRDTKPSNILVATHDGAGSIGVPKVIDFGIAKATSGRLIEATIQTQVQQFMGTPAYMSPEQAGMGSHEIDARSDVYSLGVLLYQLLTGNTPFDPATLASKSFDEIRRTIRETEPARPSTRLAKLTADQLTMAARCRGIETPSLLLDQLRGDLDWVVMKCLEKTPSNRYPSAAALAHDLGRHLADEPVSARPPDLLYRTRKFGRRHRFALGMGTVLALFVAALVALVSLLVRDYRAGKYGGIVIRSEPPGAEVWSQGKLIGVTLFEIPKVELGPFTYSLSLDNYLSVTNQSLVAARQKLNDFTVLRPLAPVGLSAAAAATNVTQLSLAASRGVTVLALSEHVEVSRLGSDRWDAASEKMVLQPGDRIRTGEKSRATLRMQDGNIVHFSELTMLRIGEPNASQPGDTPAELIDGTIQRFNRDGTTNRFRIETPVFSGEIRG